MTVFNTDQTISKEEESRRAFEAETVVGGFKIAELRGVFESYCRRQGNKDDWKGPIDWKVATQRLPIVMAAIEFFTGTTPGAVEVDHISGLPTYQVKSEGYREGPCGP